MTLKIIIKGALKMIFLKVILSFIKDFLKFLYYVIIYIPFVVISGILGEIIFEFKYRYEEIKRKENK